jgi:hypothetical protein
MADSNDEQILTRLKGLETRLHKAQDKSPTRDRALAITNIGNARLWLAEHIARYPGALV